MMRLGRWESRTPSRNARRVCQGSSRVKLVWWMLQTSGVRPAARVATCSACHADQEAHVAASLHGQALARGDPLAPLCQSCHGTHAILPVKAPLSAVAPIQVPFVCGQCHREGGPVAEQRTIHQDHILENYSESMHAQGLLSKGLSVAATCTSCHTSHDILPHTDPRSSIARENIAATCTRCHAAIERVHVEVIRGELWEKEAHVLPACVDCHQPHKASKVVYDPGLDCMNCHAQPGVAASADGRSLFVDAAEHQASRHANIGCSQCHAQVSRDVLRGCETITQPVDCTSCHTDVGAQYALSVHGQLAAEGSTNAPTCKECHGRHGVLGREDPASRTFPTNVPTLCATCHREGQKAALRYTAGFREYERRAGAGLGVLHHA